MADQPQYSQDSQEYADDAVYSHYIPQSPAQQPGNESIEPDEKSNEPSSRPDQSVKACKSIRVIFAHDLSGSMEENRKMIADGTNEFVQDLQSRYAPPCDHTAKFCLMTFAGDAITIGEWTDVQAVPVFDAKSFICSGTTPLWDACSLGIDKINHECNGCTTALYVFTDGDDNNSRKATRKTVRSQISNLDSTIHTMLFIGSDPLSSAANADAIGVTRTKSLNPSSDNTPSAMRACTNTIARCVTGETQTPEFNDTDIAMSEGPPSRQSSLQSYHMVNPDDDYHEDDSIDVRTPAITRRQPVGGGPGSPNNYD